MSETTDTDPYQCFNLMSYRMSCDFTGANNIPDTTTQRIHDKLQKAHERAEQRRLQGQKPTKKQVDQIIQSTQKPSWEPW